VVRSSTKRCDDIIASSRFPSEEAGGVAVGGGGGGSGGRCREWLATRYVNAHQPG
jgi:hypothetical protein